MQFLLPQTKQSFFRCVSFSPHTKVGYFDNYYYIFCGEYYRFASAWALKLHPSYIVQTKFHFLSIGYLFCLQFSLLGLETLVLLVLPLHAFSALCIGCSGISVRLYPFLGFVVVILRTLYCSL